MKYIMVIMLMFLSVLGYSQTDTIPNQLPDTVFTQQQVLDIANYIDSLEQENSKLNKLNEANILLTDNLKYKIKLLNDFRTQDSIMADLKDREINFLNTSLDRWKQVEVINRRKWYDKPFIWYLAGAVTLYISSEIVANVK